MILDAVEQLEDDEEDEEEAVANCSASRSKAQIFEKRNPLVHNNKTSEMKMTDKTEILDDDGEREDEEEEPVGVDEEDDEWFAPNLAAIDRLPAEEADRRVTASTPPPATTDDESNPTTLPLLNTKSPSLPILATRPCRLNRG